MKLSRLISSAILSLSLVFTPYSVQNKTENFKRTEITEAINSYAHRHNNITRGNKNFREIALTFDCHWHDTTTPKVLDILKEKNVKATFFLTGDYIKRCPEVVKRIYKEGHEIENHLDSHKALAAYKNKKYYTRTSCESLEKLLKGTDDKLYPLIGKKTHYWRAPYGAFTDEILEYGEKTNHEHVYCTTDTSDWKKVSKDKIEQRRDSIEEKIYKELKNGAIILMHPRTQIKFSEKKLPKIIDEIRKKGYSLVTISQVLNDKQDYTLSLK